MFECKVVSTPPENEQSRILSMPGSHCFPINYPIGEHVVQAIIRESLSPHMGRKFYIKIGKSPFCLRCSGHLLSGNYPHASREIDMLITYLRDAAAKATPYLSHQERTYFDALIADLP